MLAFMRNVLWDAAVPIVTVALQQIGFHFLEYQKHSIFAKIN
jgi:hypothetical protein